MAARERHQIILKMLEEQGLVTVVDLCQQFRVSDMTIRRDLAILERQSLLRRIHGGAVSLHGRGYEPPFLTRSQEAQDFKKAIAARAAQLVDDGDSIAIDVGTTTLEFAKNLTNKRNVTVFTASLPVANVLADHSGVRLVLTGGVLRSGEHSMVGWVAEDTFSRFHVDKAFLGIGGLDPEIGLTEYNLDDARVKQALIGCGEKKILLADSRKFGRRALASVAPISAVHQIITDKLVDAEMVTLIRKQGIEVTIVCAD